MPEKNYEQKRPPQLEKKPVDKKVSEKTARTLGGAAIKGAGKK